MGVGGVVVPPQPGGAMGMNAQFSGPQSAFPHQQHQYESGGTSQVLQLVPAPAGYPLSDFTTGRLSGGLSSGISMGMGMGGGGLGGMGLGITPSAGTSSGGHSQYYAQQQGSAGVGIASAAGGGSGGTTAPRGNSYGYPFAGDSGHSVLAGQGQSPLGAPSTPYLGHAAASGGLVGGGLAGGLGSGTGRGGMALTLPPFGSTMHGGLGSVSLQSAHHAAGVSAPASGAADYGPLPLPLASFGPSPPPPARPLPPAPQAQSQAQAQAHAHAQSTAAGDGAGAGSARAHSGGAGRQQAGAEGSSSGTLAGTGLDLPLLGPDALRLSSPAPGSSPVGLVAGPLTASMLGPSGELGGRRGHAGGAGTDDLGGSGTSVGGSVGLGSSFHDAPVTMGTAPSGVSGPPYTDGIAFSVPPERSAGGSLFPSLSPDGASGSLTMLPSNSGLNASRA